MLLVVGYLAFYLGVGWVVGKLFGGVIDEDDLLGNAASILAGVVLPIAVGGLALALFAARLGWLSAIFGRQRVEARRWMWIGPILALLAIAAHVVGTDWGAWSAGQLLALVLVGVCVGFTEELLTRGFVVKMVRDAGHGEFVVAAVSSLLFALLHLSNLISGMDLETVLPTVVYTFAFGVCMYLTMRVTGTIWAAILVHGLTDPTTILTTGGIDESVIQQNSGASALGGIITIVLIIFGFVAVLFVRGRAKVAEAN